ncbi:FAD binding domain-containing protein [Streptomyces sp. NBC_01239]|uniref:FAD binding domain-containing protein n=1 Tax=Streptomyces sp. NBC_01239 TaxID=2903792 RepID=UPI00224EEF4E|nr:FAD binding domain-containing protein [Streptomyces sp. NBC_01239]MCX4810983.1 FAD binding domain-containing protein [Streptomyces sp. NBC_01239]
MHVRLPRSVSEAQSCLAEGAVPVGGATLVWAGWQRDGFPEQAMSLREVPEAKVIGDGTLGSAVLLHEIDERVPEVLRKAAGGVGTGAVRRTATVGGNIVGSTLRCLLPAALVLDARALVLEPDGPVETDLAELLAKKPLLLSLRWPEPVATGYRKLTDQLRGEVPFVVAVAVGTTEGTDTPVLRVAVRDGYDVLSETVPYAPDTGRILRALALTPLGTLPEGVFEAVRDVVDGVVERAEAR